MENRDGQIQPLDPRFPIGESPDTPVSATPDRRQANRHMAVFLLVRLEAGGRQTIGRVVNISARGAKVETILPLSVGQDLQIELRSDTSLSGTVRWVAEKTAGIEFDHDVPLQDFLTRKQSKLAKIKPRPPRFESHAAASIISDDETIPGEVRDISLHGARIAGEFQHKLNDQVVVAIDGLSRRRARIAWIGAGQIGVEFLKSLDFRELGNWLAETPTP